jgi:multiple sugar transport system substrate-binding protein
MKPELMIVLYAAWVIMVASCSGQPPSSIPPDSSPTPQERVVVRWLVDTGGSWRPEQAWLDEFNKSQDRVQLVLMLVHLSPDWLKTEIAAYQTGAQADLPDIVGPSSPEALAAWESSLLDLKPYLQDHDLSDFDPGALRFWQDENGRQFGLPVALYPSILLYNRDLFDAAGVAYPPHHQGESYADGRPWDIQKLEEIATRLTIDEQGKKPNMPGFNPQDIAQFGFYPQWNSAEQIAALFGPTPLMNVAGNVILPDSWRQAFRWYYAGMWEKHFIPSGTQVSDDPDLYDAFDFKRVAMVSSHTYYLPSLPNWDMAVLPSYGEYMPADTYSEGFAVLGYTAHPQEAAQALAYLASIPGLSQTLAAGGIPARASLQAAALASLGQRFAQGVDWQVALDNLRFPDTPGFDSRRMADPWFHTRLYQWLDDLNKNPDLNPDSALDELQADFQAHLSP